MRNSTNGFVTLQNNELHLVVLVEDVAQFIWYNRQMIEEAPLHTYVSAVLFAPRESSVRQIFSKQQPQWINSLSLERDDWSRLIQVFVGHAGRVNAVAMSLNGLLLASASDDRTVRLWKEKSGVACGTLQCHLAEVKAVTFSCLCYL